MSLKTTIENKFIMINLCDGIKCSDVINFSKFPIIRFVVVPKIYCFVTFKINLILSYIFLTIEFETIVCILCHKTDQSSFITK